ncbi:MAG: fumarylacetoacetate hydrolase family protein [Thalassovita sp.]
MLTEAERLSAAHSLIEAEKTAVQAPQVSVQFPNVEIDDAYAISQTVARLRAEAGGVLIGHKVGLTSKAMQASSKIDEPDYGHVFQDMMIEDGASVNTADFCRPRVEPELTFIMNKSLRGPNVTLNDVLNATEWVVPSIEIIDARVLEPRKIYDTVSDNGAAAGLILGKKRFRPDDIDLRWAGALFRRNGEIEETGIAAGVMDHPGNAVAWLCNKLASFDVGMQAGHLILSGSFTRPVFASKGDELVADFGPLGSVSVTFA